ncbi:MAG: 5'-nucleotidase C-terminal domain-containing protein [Ignavibacteriaceae bacterium]|nr:5'-nucleotidase C-terminal domain-containing protein [Ignavibacteriaceae bacterium]
MKNLILLFTVILCASLNAQVDTITILHINDTHSTLAPLAPRDINLKGTRGGIARAASVIGMTQATEPNVVTLHGGDFFIGDLFFNKFFGVAELEFLKALNFDAIALGNHEFDLGPEALYGCFEAAFATNAIPVLSANAILDGFSPLQPYIKKTHIIQKGNSKIGLIGLTTPSTNLFSLPAPVVIDTIDGYLEAALTELLTQQCNVIILMSHLGIMYDRAIAESVPGINVIISAHDHYKTIQPEIITNPAGKPVYIVQTSANYTEVGKLTLAATSTDVSVISYLPIELDNTIPEEPTTKDMVDTLITQIEALYGPVYTQQIGYAAGTFWEVARPSVSADSFDTPLGNLVTDAFRWKTGTQVALTVGGSTAQPIYEGPIVPADAFRAIGYGFDTIKALGYRIIKCGISGADLIMGLEFGLQAIEYDDELLPQVSGMNYSFDINAAGPGRVTGVTIGGQPLDPGTVYTATLNEFLAYALQAMVGVTLIDPYMYEDSTEFEVLMAYIIANQMITPGGVGRITSVKDDFGEADRITGFNLEQNYPNPFNPSTTINYFLPKAGFVSLRIYDLSGALVTTLVDSYQEEGSYSVVFDVSSRNLASGTYFYRLESGGKSLTKKLLLVK